MKHYKKIYKHIFYNINVKFKYKIFFFLMIGLDDRYWRYKLKFVFTFGVRVSFGVSFGVRVGVGVGGGVRVRVGVI